jgi:hypothetical protein
MMYRCSELLLVEGDIPTRYHPDIIAYNDERDPLKGDANCQRRLTVLLWAWTDKDVDWQGFLWISQTDPLVGSKMWEAVILNYQINTSTEIITHSKTLRLPQAEGQISRTSGRM